MTFRRFLPSETAQARRIWEACFDDKPDYTELFFSRRYSPEGAYGIFMEEPVSMLQVFRRRVIIRGAGFDTGLVVGVATLPEYRKRGLAKELMAKSLAVMRDEGYAFAHLYPESYEIYRGSGFETVSACQKYAIHADELRREIIPEGYEFREARLEDIGDLKRVHAAFLAGRSGWFERSGREWEYRVLESKLYGGGILLASRGGEPEAYMTYQPHENGIESDETAYVSEGALYALIAKTLEKTEGKLVFTAPVSCGLFTRLRDGRKGACAIEPFGMARIVDLRAALENMPAPSGVRAAARIRVIDDAAPWNAGAFELACENGRFRLSDVKAGGVDIGIGRLTQVVCGFVPAKTLIAAGLLDAGEDADALDEMFPAEKDIFLFEKY